MVFNSIVNSSRRAKFLPTTSNDAPSFRNNIDVLRPIPDDAPGICSFKDEEAQTQ